jgi:hypothetical protein
MGYTYRLHVYRPSAGYSKQCNCRELGQLQSEALISLLSNQRITRSKTEDTDAVIEQVSCRLYDTLPTLRGTTGLER